MRPTMRTARTSTRRVKRADVESGQARTGRSSGSESVIDSETARAGDTARSRPGPHHEPGGAVLRSTSRSRAANRLAFQSKQP